MTLPGQATPLRCMLFACASLCCVVLLSTPARAESKAHHITVGAGYFSLLSDDLRFSATGPIGQDLGTADLTSGGLAAIRYRYSLTRLLGLTFEGRATTKSGDIPFAVHDEYDMTVRTYWFGPGIQISPALRQFRPYGQASLLLVTESLRTEHAGRSGTESDTSVGFGVCAGMDIRVSDLLSVPLELGYAYGKPAADVSGIGASAGLTFNFGQSR